MYAYHFEAHECVSNTFLLCYSSQQQPPGTAEVDAVRLLNKCAPLTPLFLFVVEPDINPVQ